MSRPSEYGTTTGTFLRKSVTREWFFDLLAVGLVTLAMIVAIVLAMGYPELARWFPLSLGMAGLAMSLAATAILLITRRPMGKSPEDVGSEATLASTLRYLIWIGILCVAAFLVGLSVGGALFLVAFLWREARMRWWSIALCATGWICFIFFLDWVFPLRWPESLLGLFV